MYVGGKLHFYSACQEMQAKAAELGLVSILINSHTSKAVGKTGWWEFKLVQGSLKCLHNQTKASCTKVQEVLL